MIGYYVHHVGHGHRHQARSLVDTLLEPVVVLSSAPRPPDWPGEWVLLPRDDTGPSPRDPDAAGALHWAPLHDDGLRERTAALSAWIARHRPRAMVVDVSVEVTALARLHGVPVVSVLLPGRRDDAAHRLGFSLTDRLVAFWPPEATDPVAGLDAGIERRVRRVGALSRFPVASTVGASATSRPGHAPHVVVLAGTGGTDPGWCRGVAAARAQTPGWRWTVLGGPDGRWVEDPSAVLEQADVVLTHAGQNALAETAAARRPAVVVPQSRPHDEQVWAARSLRDGTWPVLVQLDGMPQDGWAGRLARAAALDGLGWTSWCDGKAADRFADVVSVVADRAAR